MFHTWAGLAYFHDVFKTNVSYIKQNMSSRELILPLRCVQNECVIHKAKYVGKIVHRILVDISQDWPLGRQAICSTSKAALALQSQSNAICSTTLNNELNYAQPNYCSS
jgi:hypothetical protein